jgi:hydrogenase-4 component E
MTDYLDALSILILFSSIILVSNKRIKSYIRTFRFQSVLIAFVTGIMGVQALYTSGRIDILLVCLIMIALKVIYIPNLLYKTYANIDYKIEKDFFFNIPLHVFVCSLLVLFSFFALSAVEDINAGVVNMQVVNMVSVVLIGLYFMITRKKAIGQIVGFLVIENGLFVTAVFATNGMPFIVDLGIFIDILTAVLIMGILVFRIHEQFDSIDINKLKNLKG